jgi:hypothetical protein
MTGIVAVTVNFTSMFLRPCIALEAICEATFIYGCSNRSAQISAGSLLSISILNT